MKLYKIVLKILVVLLAFCLGFILSELRYTTNDQVDDVCQQIDDFHQLVYLYDMKKIEDYYGEIERENIGELGWNPESSETRWMIDRLRSERPLVRVGPFVIFASNDNSRFTVREQSSRSTLVSLDSREQTKTLTFASSVEKDWKMPRFRAQFTYSEDGVYEKGSFATAIATRGEEVRTSREYLDTKGSGEVDVMFVNENGWVVRYRLNGLTWELVDSPPPFGRFNPLTGLPISDTERDVSDENVETE